MQKWFFFDGSSLPGDHTIELENTTKVSKGISSCTSEFISLNNSYSSSKEPSSSLSQRDSLDGKARFTEMKSQSPDKPKYHFNSKQVWWFKICYWQ